MPIIVAYADLLNRLGRIEEGVAEVEKALAQGTIDADLALRPYFSGALFNLGMVEADLGRWQSAKGAFERVLAADPRPEERWRTTAPSSCQAWGEPTADWAGCCGNTTAPVPRYL